MTQRELIVSILKSAAQKIWDMSFLFVLLFSPPGIFVGFLIWEIFGGKFLFGVLLVVAGFLVIAFFRALYGIGRLVFIRKSALERKRETLRSWSLHCTKCGHDFNWEKFETIGNRCPGCGDNWGIVYQKRKRRYAS